jgi:LPXTG-motif cell wall-anchored protein
MGPLELATETGKVVIPAARLAAAECDSWQLPAQPAASKQSPVWIAAAVAVLVAGAAALLVRRRRAAASAKRG